jgi:subtilisin family serine protease
MQKQTLSLLLAPMLLMGLAVNAQADSMRYLLVAKSANSLPKNLDKMAAKLGGEVAVAMPEIGVAVLKSSNINFAGDLQNDKSIRAVLPDRMFPLPEGELEIAAANPPNSGDDDFLFDLQWGHDAVNAPEAWEAGVRGQGALVAVLDTGSDCEHPDLAPNCRTDLNTSFLDVPLPDWWHFHGSHTAGTIAAADNGYGTIGVAPDAEFFGVQVCGTAGCPASAIVPGIVYAASQGADVINMSLGGIDVISGAKVVKDCKEAGLPMDYCASLQSSYLHDEILIFTRAFQYANRMNTTVVVSAGNSAADADHQLLPTDEGLLHIPSMRLSFADYPGTIGVSATAPINWCNHPDADFNNLTTYSNFGHSAIDFSAPGGEGWYFDGDEDPCTVAGVTVPAWVFDLVLSTNNVFGWSWAAGTSMAAPHVSGLAALIVGENGGDMSPAQVLSELRKRAEDAGAPGNDPEHGFGAARSGY